MAATSADISTGAIVGAGDSRSSSVAAAVIANLRAFSVAFAGVLAVVFGDVFDVALAGAVARCGD
jgi:hypothetical protein